MKRLPSLPRDGHASATLGRLALALSVAFAGALELQFRLGFRVIS
jgi:hypothetical protein